MTKRQYRKVRNQDNALKKEYQNLKNDKTKRSYNRMVDVSGKWIKVTRQLPTAKIPKDHKKYLKIEWKAKFQKQIL